MVADGGIASVRIADSDDFQAFDRGPRDRHHRSRPIQKRDARIPVREGVELAGTLFEPAGAPKRAILINGATGTPQSFYEDFAAWLADSDSSLVLTYDYRDSGASKTGHPRTAMATMSDWGIADQAGALDFLSHHHSDLPVWVIGHSLGGMFFAFHPNAGRIERAIVIGAGPGYWLGHPLTFMPQILAFWWLVAPLATAVFGYMPGKMLGLGSDLPKGVYWQWRRWCLTREFYRIDYGRDLPEPDPARLTCPVRIIGIADDVMITPATAKRMADFYPDAEIEHRLISPDDVGGNAIGHLGLFKQHNAALWPRLID